MSEPRQQPDGARASMTIARGGCGPTRMPSPRRCTPTSSTCNEEAALTQHNGIVQPQRTSVPFALVDHAERHHHDTSSSVAHYVVTSDHNEQWQAVPRQCGNMLIANEGYEWQQLPLHDILDLQFAAVQASQPTYSQSSMLPATDVSESMRRWLAEPPNEAPFSTVTTYRNTGHVKADNALPIGDVMEFDGACDPNRHDSSTSQWSWELI